KFKYWYVVTTLSKQGQARSIQPSRHSAIGEALALSRPLILLALVGTCACYWPKSAHFLVCFVALAPIGTLPHVLILLAEFGTLPRLLINGIGPTRHASSSAHLRWGKSKVGFLGVRKWQS
ncbi:unnamed protein product, partial [Laminaria digitata]